MAIKGKRLSENRICPRCESLQCESPQIAYLLQFGGGKEKKKRTLTESNCDKTITQILTVDSIRKQRIKRKQILFTKG